MKKICIVTCMLMLLFTAGAQTAFAYINRGTVHISCDTKELMLEVGQTAQITYGLDPESSDQMPGCGKSDCPEDCGPGCMSKDGNCTCGIITYQTYYPEVQVKKADESIVSVSTENGVATFTAVAPGKCTVNLAARLREHTGSSVDIEVTVLQPEKAPVIWPWLTGAGVAAAAVAVSVGLTKRNRRNHES